MARVPTYNERQVMPGVLPAAKVESHADQYRAGQQALSRGIGSVAGVVAKMAEQEQQKANESALFDLENKLVSQRQSFLSDPERGALTVQGKGAIGMTGRLMPEWQKTTGQLLQDTPQHLRAQAERLIARHGQQVEGTLQAHEVKQSDIYHRQTALTGVTLAEEEAVTVRHTPALVDQAVDRALQYATSEGIRLNLDEPTLKLARLQTASKIYRKAIEATISDNPDTAAERLAQWRGFLTADDQLQLSRQLQPAVDDRMGQAIGAQILDGNVPLVSGGHFNGEVTRIKPSTALESVPVEERRRLVFNAPELNGYAAATEQRYGLPPGLINALKNAGEKSNSWQVSPAGARGVMQFIPHNLAKYGVRDPLDPVQMIDAAGRYLSDTMRFYKGNVAAVIADYNGGPRQAQHVMASREPTAKETQGYLQRVLGALGGAAQVGGKVEVNETTPVEALIARIPLNLPRAQRAAAEGFIRDRVAARQAATQERDRAAGLAIYDKVARAPHDTPLSKLLTPQELYVYGNSPELSASIGRFRSAMASGDLITDDPKVVDRIFRLQATDPNAFKRLPLATYADRLSGKTLLSLINDQQALTKSPEKSAQWASESQIIDLAADSMGLDTKRTGEFRVAYFREKQQWVQREKREPTADETQAIVNRLKLPFVKPGWFGNAKRFGWEGAAEGYAVPAEDRQQIIDALKRRGIATTEQNIVTAYMRGAGSEL